MVGDNIHLSYLFDTARVVSWEISNLSAKSGNFSTKFLNTSERLNNILLMY